ncbi:MAG: hypothetical protein HZB91_14800 [Elusimicrobia bacterium]|nr:hypothetical protein [Elusimicrobiota bacterium]
MIARSLPAMFCGLLLAAHFLRGGHLLVSVACLGVPWLLLTERRWALHLTRAMLCMGVAVWILTTVRYTEERIAAGEPYQRLVAILGGVAVFHGIALLPLFGKSVAERFR